jgi:chromosome segregation ATPase
MSVAKNLEALINMENQLKAQYEAELKTKENQIDALTKSQATLQAAQASLEATIEKQKSLMAELTVGSNETKRLEQTNRELNNRAEKLQGEVDMQKNRAKALSKDLAEARQQIKTLEQYDAEKLKKNLVAAKQTIAEQRTANELLNKTANKTKAENAELQATLKTVQDELEALKATTAPVLAEETETTADDESKAA